MKSSAVLSLCAATLAAAAAHPNAEQLILQDPMLKPTIVELDEYLIELSPGETRLVTEDEKWALRRVRYIELHEAS
jgi:leucyl aminopeptidase